MISFSATLGHWRGRERGQEMKKGKSQKIDSLAGLCGGVGCDVVDKIFFAFLG